MKDRSFVSSLLAGAYIEFKPLTNIPGFQQVGDGQLMGFFVSIYKLAISAGAVLAVLIMIFAGLRYMTIDAQSKEKTASKKMIQNAVLGLVLLLGTYLIFKEINPDILKFNIELSPITTSGRVETMIDSMTRHLASTPTAEARQGGDWCTQPLLYGDWHCTQTQQSCGRSCSYYGNGNPEDSYDSNGRPTPEALRNGNYCIHTYVQGWVCRGTAAGGFNYYNN